MRAGSSGVASSVFLNQHPVSCKHWELSKGTTESEWDGNCNEKEKKPWRKRKLSSDAKAPKGKEELQIENEPIYSKKIQAHELLK